jgi:hypothetical protein
MNETVFVPVLDVPMRKDVPTRVLTADEKLEHARHVAVLLEAQLARIALLHRPTSYLPVDDPADGEQCRGCDEFWPCATAEILLEVGHD